MKDAYRRKWKLDIGSNPTRNGKCEFRVWAPNANTLELELIHDARSIRLPMREEESLGYRSVVTDAVEGDRYFYVIDGKKKRPDPASRYQPSGVYGPSEIVDPENYKWSDKSWKGIKLDELIIYELHVGTFTKAGMFESIAPYLSYLRSELGISAIELMPVAQFPGVRNWGYDGVLLYSVQNSYGGPVALKKLVDLCHSYNLAVILDVVYNHVGPEGSYLSEFGPYFSKKYVTPWGNGINYDESGSDCVRNHVINNVLYWISEYHIDALRLDAVHAIFDSSPKHILQEIMERVDSKEKELGKKIHVIAESDLNDPKIIRPKEKCGYGVDSQWSDDFHHAIHAYLTGERNGYYQDFGILEDVEKGFVDGFVYDGKFSNFRKRRHGSPPTGLSGASFVVCIQNHDQVGNRADGRRLASLVDPRSLRLAAGLLLLSPYIPLLFMGEEFGETSPFYFFTDYSDPDLIRSVREGRRKEFEVFKFHGEFVDPQAISTYEQSKINHELLKSEENRNIFHYYQRLIDLRKMHPALRDLSKENLQVRSIRKKDLLMIRRRKHKEEVVVFYSFCRRPVSVSPFLRGKSWMKIFDSENLERSPENVRSLRKKEEIVSPKTVVIYSRSA